MSTTVTMPDEKWVVWTDLGQTNGHMIGFTTHEEFDRYEHEYNVKTYGENYQELFEQYEAESEEYNWELEKKEMANIDHEQEIENVEDFMTESEQQSTAKSNEPRWLSDEEVRQAGIEFNGVDLESPEEMEKGRLMFEEMEAETNFINNLKVKTVLDDGTVLETEFSQLEKIC